MRRLVVVGVLVGGAILIVRQRMPKLHERAMAHCEAMFQRMPDIFPPKRMMRGIDEIRVRTATIQELLEDRAINVGPEAAAAEPVCDVA